MIVFLKNNAINKKKWDACIEQSINGYVYAYSWYLDIVAPGWMALVEGDYQAVFPLPVKRRYGFYYLHQPPFVQQLGLFSRELPDSVQVSSFLASIPAWIRYGEINLNKFNNLLSDGQLLRSRRTNELDLIRPYFDIRLAYHQNLKRNLKKAGLCNFQYSSQGNPEEIVRAFSEQKNQDNKYFASTDFSKLFRLIFEGVNKGRTQMRYVYGPYNEFVAGSVFFESHQKVIFLFSGQTAYGKEHSVLAWLLDKFIEENSNRNLILDFEGSDHPGLDRFYKGFGAKECLYLHWSRNQFPDVVKKLIRVWKKFK